MTARLLYGSVVPFRLPRTFRASDNENVPAADCGCSLRLPVGCPAGVYRPNAVIDREAAAGNQKVQT
jgi:hypothetical protein